MFIKQVVERLERLLKLGGARKDIVLLVISGAAVLCSLLKISPFPFDMAWVAIILCGVPIILEAVIGLVTAFDIKADMLVSLALIASVCIGEIFAAGEVAFIMQLGAPEVVAVGSVSGSPEKDEVYRLAASVEQFSEHPLGKAIMDCYRKEGGLPADANAFEMIPGRGVCAEVEGKTVLAGNPELLQERGVRFTPAKDAEAHIQRGCTVIYVAVNAEFAGFIALSDTLRKESAATIAALSDLGVQSVLLTGDRKNAAAAIADQLQIGEVRANCLPEDKLKVIGEYQSRSMPVCMIGDGINDAPALKKADVGIAMGGVGSDIAVDAAGIALVDDEVKELPHLIALSKRMMTTVKLNIIFSMTLNFIAIALAIIGTLNPVVGALVHNAGSVLVIANSALLLKWEKKKRS